MHPLSCIEHFNGPPQTWAEMRNVGCERTGAQAQQHALSVGEPPCTGCPLAARCGEKMLACEAFYQYAERNRFDEDKRVGPTRALYRSVMASS